MELNNYNVSKIILIGGEPLMFDGINKLVVFVRKIFPNAKTPKDGWVKTIDFTDED